MQKEGIIGNFINKVSIFIATLMFSKDKKYERWMIGLVVVGFILRLIAALHLDTLADDMVFASQSAGIISSNIISTHSNPALFFYLSDFAYKIFGYTVFASRFFPLIAGTMLIPLTFIITRKLFNEKVALASAFFVTFSNFLVRMTFSEQSLVVLFFAFSATYFGLRYLDNMKIRELIWTGIFFGLALLTKYSAPFFILSFLVFAFYYMKLSTKNENKKINKKHFWAFIFILLLFALPFLAFNLFLYHDKGIVDVYFSRVIHVEKANQLYGGLAGQENNFFGNVININNYYNYNLVWISDLILCLFALVGFALLFRRKLKNQLAFLLIFLIIPFVFQSAGAPLQKHFAFMYILFAIPAGYALNEVWSKLNIKYIKIIGLVILTGLLFVNLGVGYGTPPSYFYSSETSQVKSFIDNNVKADELVVLDSRIYTARAMWEATDKHFLNIQQFPEFYRYNLNLSARITNPTNVYFIECAIDDCGWGWVAKEKNLNESSELLFNDIKDNARKVADIYSYDYSGNELLDEKNKTLKYSIYSVSLQLNPSLVEQTDKIQSFYFVPYMYENMAGYVFNYDVSGIYSWIDKLSLLIIYIAMILTLVGIILIILEI